MHTHTTEAMMTTQQIANRMSVLFRENKWEQAQDELFDGNAVSIEPSDHHGLQSVEGIEAIKKKTVDFNREIEEVHSGYLTEPVIAGRYIAIGMGMDATLKKGTRIQIDEIAIYEVKEGKIIKEQFFY